MFLIERRELLGDTPDKLVLQFWIKNQIRLHLLESNFRVEVPLVLSREIIKGEKTKTVAMSRIRVGVRAGEVRGCDEYSRPGSSNTVDLLHCLHNISEMLDDVRAVDEVKRVVIKWPWDLVQVVENVRGGTRINVNPNRTSNGLILSAAEAKYSHGTPHETGLCFWFN